MCQRQSGPRLPTLAIVLAGLGFGGLGFGSLGFGGPGLGGVALPSAPADVPAIAAHQHAEKKHFTDSEIIEGFFKTAFGAEFHLAGRVDRIRKYERPVRVFIDAVHRPDRRAQFAGVIADIARHVQHLDIAVTQQRDTANIVATMVRDRDLDRTMSTLYGSDKAGDIRKSLDPQCLSGFRKNDTFEILNSDVLLTVDNGEFVFFDCAYEEMLQSLGPINDTNTVPWTMFNDAVQMGYFDVYDQYILNILYDPRVRAGMTVNEVREILPQVLADVRSFVARINNLGP